MLVQQLCECCRRALRKRTIHAARERAIDIGIFQGNEPCARSCGERIHARYYGHRAGNRITAKCCINLASNLQAQGRHAEAGALWQRALAIHRRLLGEGHVDTALSYNNVADYFDTGKQYAEAEPLIRKALEILRRQLGED